VPDTENHLEIKKIQNVKGFFNRVKSHISMTTITKTSGHCAQLSSDSQSLPISPTGTWKFISQKELTTTEKKMEGSSDMDTAWGWGWDDDQQNENDKSIHSDSGENKIQKNKPEDGNGKVTKSTVNVGYVQSGALTWRSGKGTYRIVAYKQRIDPRLGKEDITTLYYLHIKHPKLRCQLMGYEKWTSAATRAVLFDRRLVVWAYLEERWILQNKFVPKVPKKTDEKTTTKSEDTKSEDTKSAEIYTETRIKKASMSECIRELQTLHEKKEISDRVFKEKEDFCTRFTPKPDILAIVQSHQNGEGVGYGTDPDKRYMHLDDEKHSEQRESFKKLGNNIMDDLVDNRYSDDSDLESLYRSEKDSLYYRNYMGEDYRDSKQITGDGYRPLEYERASVYSRSSQKGLLEFQKEMESDEIFHDSSYDGTSQRQNSQRSNVYSQRSNVYAGPTRSAQKQLQTRQNKIDSYPNQIDSSIKHSQNSQKFHRNSRSSRRGQYVRFQTKEFKSDKATFGGPDPSAVKPDPKSNPDSKKPQSTVDKNHETTKNEPEKFIYNGRCEHEPPEDSWSNVAQKAIDKYELVFGKLPDYLRRVDTMYDTKFKKKSDREEIKPESAEVLSEKDKQLLQAEQGQEKKEHEENV